PVRLLAFASSVMCVVSPGSGQSQCAAGAPQCQPALLLCRSAPRVPQVPPIPRITHPGNFNVSSPHLPASITDTLNVLNCYPSLDHSAGRLGPSFGQRDCITVGRFSSSVGGSLPIALCGRSSL